ncbi:hypothetical protein A2160_05675 [Candidatus Beckwithbacteria bacterium RBG_13_42_9]|uniref:Cysteine--tRNA ligase n=1 Tax=Candidatus Beckwithbacteria bacterium RBG_13_42_9 TaxID=1797457 RepID=A0A1F5E613_9BACT|nr:MAG: hypothetical protein A2160_05675 [Candidatus Beckwithbacteria bacterium RBG_13_42_9]
MLVDGGKMSKSLGNVYTLDDIEKRGYKPEHLRYFYLTGHYRQPLNFTWEGLEKAKQTLDKLWEKAQMFGEYTQTKAEDRDPSDKVLKRWNQFQEAINDDLNFPRALASLHEGLNEARDDFDTLFLLQKTDPILGLKFTEHGKLLHKEWFSNVGKFKADLTRREEFRKRGEFAKADEIRKEIEAKGFVIEDTDSGTQIKKRE